MAGVLATRFNPDLPYLLGLTHSRVSPSPTLRAKLKDSTHPETSFLGFALSAPSAGLSPPCPTTPSPSSHPASAAQSSPPTGKIRKSRQGHPKKSPSTPDQPDFATSPWQHGDVPTVSVFSPVPASDSHVEVSTDPSPWMLLVLYFLLPNRTL